MSQAAHCNGQFHAPSVGGIDLPLQSVAPSRAEDYQCGFKHVNLSKRSVSLHPKRKVSGLVSETYHFRDHVLGALAVEDLHHHSGLQAGLLQ
jgi:hypothetical protein